MVRTLCEGVHVDNADTCDAEGFRGIEWIVGCTAAIEIQPGLRIIMVGYQVGSAEIFATMCGKRQNR